MEYYLLQEHWSSLVRKFKDEERGDTRASEEITNFVLNYMHYAPIRQYRLFAQKRGEDFERMFIIAEQKGHDVEALRRFIENDERWATALELAEQ